MLFTVVNNEMFVYFHIWKGGTAPLATPCLTPAPFSHASLAPKRTYLGIPMLASAFKVPTNRCLFPNAPCSAASSTLKKEETEERGWTV